MIPGSINNLLLSPKYSYTINNSLRLRASNSARLTRTPASAGNRKTWTWSAWIKRGLLSTTRTLFESNSGSDYFRFDSNDRLELYFNNTNTLLTTSVHRDPSGWYHILLAVDTTQTTNTNRVKIYVNGQEITVFSFTNYPSLNTDGFFNNTVAHTIGAQNTSNYFDGYLSDVYFIDGQALTPSSFAYTDRNNQWSPKRYDGTYGTNGFFLEFKDATSTTTIAQDTSGNGNNFTASGISVTSGSTFDQMLDTPTNNYCVLETLSITGTIRVLSNGNLNLETDITLGGVCAGTFGVSSGKWYWEVVYTFAGGFGLVGITDNLNNVYTNGVLGFGAGYGYAGNGEKVSGSAFTAYGSAYTTNTIGVALDLDAGTLEFYRDNVSQGTAFSGLSGTFFPAIGDYSSTSSTISNVNFGQRAFTYAPPVGFKALNSRNLSNPIISKPNNYMDTKIHSGTGSVGSGTAQNITGLNFSPSLAWIKCRNDNDSNIIVDSVRGVNVRLRTDQTNSEDSTANRSISAFLSDGITVNGTTSPDGSTNIITRNYVDWFWKEDAASGFDIVTYTGNGTTQNISHSLGATSHFIIVKARNNPDNWAVYHRSLVNTQIIYLNLPNAAATSTTAWNSISPTSSQFSVGANNDTNRNGINYISYLWSEVAGFSRFNSYIGNGSTDGPFVWCGFRPRFLMVKASTGSADWAITDTSRSTYNVSELVLYPNLIVAEGGTEYVDILSSGFKIRNTIGRWNSSSVTYIFLAFAESPFKYSRAR